MWLARWKGKWLVSIAGTAVAITCIVLWYLLSIEPFRPPTSTEERMIRPTAEASGTERTNQIAVWRQALAADSGSAIVLSQLAALHSQRARETGNFEDYRLSEEFARHSLARRIHRNGAAAATLISALLAQHRFAEAMSVADSLVMREPEVPEYRAMQGEAAMELGRYDGARASFERLWPMRTHVSIAPRVARWLELTGRIPEARQLLQRAWQEVRRRRDVPTETQAWFAMRLGDLEARSGNLRAAAHHYRSGLSRRPNDARLLTAMARLSQRAGRVTEAKEWAERAVAMQPDVTTLLALASAHEAAGDRPQAMRIAAAVETLIEGSPVVHRDWWLWKLDHNQDVAEIRARAMSALIARADIFAYDVLAWALHREGRTAEARVMMRKALALGTSDPLLQAHAEVLK